MSTSLLASLLSLGPTLALDATETTTAPQMIVDPSATKVSLAKANLTVSTLRHKGQAYQGNYQLKVTPFAFKSEQGTLFLHASEETIRKISLGESVEFTGKATNGKNGKVKLVKGKTNPKDPVRGAVSFTIQTENGEMVFNTSYHLVKE